MMKYAEAYMQKQIEEYPEKYYDELPSLCHHLVEMVVGERYVFSADFLARGYRFDRLSAEKMWRMTCLPEQTIFQDVANAVFTGNPECFNAPEALLRNGRNGQNAMNNVIQNKGSEESKNE